MSISPNQRAIINEIIDNENTDYEFCGREYLSGSSAATARNLEKRALEKIGDRAEAGNDKNIIKQIALWELQRYSSVDKEKKIFLFILAHRSGYNNMLTGSDEICITDNEVFLPIVRSKLSQITLEAGTPLDEQHNGYCNIGGNIYYVGEYNKLFGRDKHWGFTYSTSTAACVYGTNMGSQPIAYEGYCFETQKGRTGYATGGSIERNQFFYLTPGGGPLTSDNWIIKFVQYGTRVVLDEDIYSNENSPWVLNEDEYKRVIVKIWIHLFFPDGSYVRTVLDRSDSADFTGANSNMATSWIYKDFANYTAQQTGKTFTNVWNNYIVNKAYRTIGGDNPNIVDVSFEWNGKHDEEQQSSQTAFHYSNHKIWKGKERR